MAFISLEAILKSAWSLHLADALPAPKGLHARRIVEEGGMRPWILHALSRGDVAELHRVGKASWHMGALLGLERFHKAGLQCPEGEAELIAFVSAVCEDANSGMWFPYWRAHGERFLGSHLLDADGRPVTAASIIRTLAERHDVDLSGVAAADRGIWRTEKVEATITRVLEGSGGRHAGLLTAVEARKDDGALITVRYLDFSEAFAGNRLVVDMVAVTDWHHGYALTSRTLESIRFQDEIRSILVGFERQPREDRSFCADGRELGVEDRVVLNCGCLEAGKGTQGAVIEIVGDMAMVRFDGIDEPVPCYGSALDLIDECRRTAA